MHSAQQICVEVCNFPTRGRREQHRKSASSDAVSASAPCDPPATCSGSSDCQRATALSRVRQAGAARWNNLTALQDNRAPLLPPNERVHPSCYLACVMISIASGARRHSDATRQVMEKLNRTVAATHPGENGSRLHSLNSARLRLPLATPQKSKCRSY